MTHAFVIADVFPETAFGGNPLAVFTDARGLCARAMQALARELNFAGSTFVLPPADPRHTRRVRIFTPNRELPFAGHPTIGTAAVLASPASPGKGPRSRCGSGGRRRAGRGRGPAGRENTVRAPDP